MVNIVYKHMRTDKKVHANGNEQNDEKTAANRLDAATKEQTLFRV